MKLATVEIIDGVQVVVVGDAQAIIPNVISTSVYQHLTENPTVELWLYTDPKLSRPSCKVIDGTLFMPDGELIPGQIPGTLVVHHRAVFEPEKCFVKLTCTF